MFAKTNAKTVLGNVSRYFTKQTTPLSPPPVVVTFEIVTFTTTTTFSPSHQPSRMVEPLNSSNPRGNSHLWPENNFTFPPPSTTTSLSNKSKWFRKLPKWVVKPITVPSSTTFTETQPIQNRFHQSSRVIMGLDEENDCHSSPTRL